MRREGKTRRHFRVLVERAVDQRNALGFGEIGDFRGTHDQRGLCATRFERAPGHLECNRARGIGCVDRQRDIRCDSEAVSNQRSKIRLTLRKRSRRCSTEKGIDLCERQQGRCRFQREIAKARAPDAVGRKRVRAKN